MNEPQATPTGVTDALERVYETSQSVLLTRVDLLVAEIRALVRDMLLTIVGALVLLGGLSWLSYGLFRGLDGHLTAVGAACAVGAVELLMGAVLVLHARRRDAAEEEKR